MTTTRHFTLEGAQSHDPDVECWLAALPGEIGSAARRWFEGIRSCGPDVLELLHDGQATACLGNLPFCYVAAYRAHINVGFYFGTVLDDPNHLLTGSGRFMRHVRISPGENQDQSALRELVTAAYRDAKARCALGFR